MGFHLDLNPEEYLKIRKREFDTKHGKDTRNNDTEKGSRKMCLILIEGKFIVVLRNKRRFGNMSHL